MKKRIWRVEVEWLDSSLLGGGWDKIAGILARRKRVIRCYSVGFVLADDKHGIVLASSIHGDEAAGVTVIPRQVIVKRRRLK